MTPFTSATANSPEAVPPIHKEPECAISHMHGRKGKLDTGEQSQLLPEMGPSDSVVVEMELNRVSMDRHTGKAFIGDAAEGRQH